jgi:uncharacterized membrane protein
VHVDRAQRSRTAIVRHETGHPATAFRRLPSRTVDTRRLESFSDGVFAVAITLLAFSLVVPAVPRADGSGGLAGALRGEWPEYAAYAVSFLVIGIIWLNHHWVFAVARAVEGRLVLANLTLLAAVAAIPFATELFSRYLATGGWNARVAAAVYSAVMVAMSVAFLALFVAVHHQAGTFASRSELWAEMRRFGSGLPVYLVAVGGLSFLSAPATLALHAVVAGYYAAVALRGVTTASAGGGARAMRAVGAAGGEGAATAGRGTRTRPPWRGDHRGHPPEVRLPRPALW